VRSIRVFAKNMGDLYCEPTIIIYDEMLRYVMHHLDSTGRKVEFPIVLLVQEMYRSCRLHISSTFTVPTT